MTHEIKDLQLSDGDPQTIGRGSGNGTIRAFRRALDRTMRRRNVPSRAWRSNPARQRARARIVAALAAQQGISI